MCVSPAGSDCGRVTRHSENACVPKRRSRHFKSVRHDRFALWRVAGLLAGRLDPGSGVVPCDAAARGRNRSTMILRPASVRSSIAILIRPIMIPGSCVAPFFASSRESVGDWYVSDSGPYISPCTPRRQCRISQSVPIGLQSAWRDFNQRAPAGGVINNQPSWL